MTFQTLYKITKTLDSTPIADIFLLENDFDKSFLSQTDRSIQDDQNFSTDLVLQITGLFALKEELILEIELNQIESVEKSNSYCNKIIETVQLKLDTLFKLLQGLDVENKVTTIDEKYISEVVHTYLDGRIFINGKTNISILNEIYLLTDAIIQLKNCVIEILNQNLNPKDHQKSATKILYLQFSGILDSIRNTLKHNPDDIITNVKLAKVISFITNEDPKNYKTLLTQVGHIANGNPHSAFKEYMISSAINQLHEDGFDVPILNKILLKMDATN